MTDSLIWVNDDRTVMGRGSPSAMSAQKEQRRLETEMAAETERTQNEAGDLSSWTDPTHEVFR